MFYFAPCPTCYKNISKISIQIMLPFSTMTDFVKAEKVKKIGLIERKNYKSLSFLLSTTFLWVLDPFSFMRLLTDRVRASFFTLNKKPSLKMKEGYAICNKNKNEVFLAPCSLSWSWLVSFFCNYHHLHRHKIEIKLLFEMARWWWSKLFLCI